MSGLNPESNINSELEERVATPLEKRIIALSEQERDDLYLDALEKLNDAEQILHTIHRINTQESHDTLF